MVMDRKTKILFLCTGNSCRSQMAQGWARHLWSDRIEAYSAGIETHGLNAKAVAVMNQAGVDISGQRSKHLDELKDVNFDYVITLCDHAGRTCPVWPGRGKMIHKPFDDPAKAGGTEEEILASFCRTRDQIKAYIEGLPELLAGQ